MYTDQPATPLASALPLPPLAQDPGPALPPDGAVATTQQSLSLLSLSSAPDSLGSELPDVSDSACVEDSLALLSTAPPTTPPTVGEPPDVQRAREVAALAALSAQFSEHPNVPDVARETPSANGTAPGCAQRPCILLFDSLGSRRRTPATNLLAYLQLLWNHHHQQQRTPTAPAPARVKAEPRPPTAPDDGVGGTGVDGPPVDDTRPGVPASDASTTCPQSTRPAAAMDTPTRPEQEGTRDAGNGPDGTVSQEAAQGGAAAVPRTPAAEPTTSRDTGSDPGKPASAATQAPAQDADRAPSPPDVGRVFDKHTMPIFLPRCPCQDNHCDCGVFLLQYCASFLGFDPERDSREDRGAASPGDAVVETPVGLRDYSAHGMNLRDWFPMPKVKRLRTEIRMCVLCVKWGVCVGGGVLA